VDGHYFSSCGVFKNLVSDGVVSKNEIKGVVKVVMHIKQLVGVCKPKNALCIFVAKDLLDFLVQVSYAMKVFFFKLFTNLGCQSLPKSVIVSL